MKHIREFFGDPKAIQDFIRKNKDMIIKAAAVAGVIVVAFFVFAVKDSGAKTVETDDKQTTTESAQAFIYVDIGGEVNKPMLAELEEGCRVEDAIKAAGGLTADADLSSINRAAFVEDGEKIFIPSMTSENDEGDGSDGYGDGSASSGKVNINTADSGQLQALTGVGPVTAASIIQYREENGRFKTIDDLKEVSGIGDKTFEKLKGDIIV